MLTPTAINSSMTMLSRSVSTQSNLSGRTIDRPPATFGAPTGSGAPPSDLNAELRERLEQDPDYQILRKHFALDRHVSSAERASSVDGERLSRTTGSSLRSASLDARFGNASVETSSLALRFAWRQESSASFEAAAIGREGAFEAQFGSLQRLSFQLDANSVRTGDPLVLDLTGEGVTTTGVDAGVQFDLTGDGQAEQVSFVTGGSWFLALDQDDNGFIDNGRELFGDQKGSANGFDELARYDSNTDGVIDAGDEVFARLRLFQIGSDGNQVLKSLSEADVTAIELGYQNTRKALNVYDSVSQIGRFQRADGSTGEASDVLLGYRRLA